AEDGIRDDLVTGVQTCALPICGHAAVGPAADAELFRIGDALGDSVINHGHVVLEVLVTPVAKNGFAEFLAVTGRAARIGEKDGEIGRASCRERGYDEGGAGARK